MKPWAPEGGLPAPAPRPKLVTLLMRELWPGVAAPELFDFRHVGVPLQRPSGGTLVFRADLRAIMADAAALSAAVCLKGASGTKPCWKRRNVVAADTGRDPEGWLVGTSALPAAARPQASLAGSGGP